MSAEADADRWWDEARRREASFLLGINGTGRRPSGARLTAALDRLSSPSWRPDRKPPRLPSRWAIASYWAGLGDDSWFVVDIRNPHCFACEMPGGYPEDETDPEVLWDSSRRLQRGHIVNRARDGLDGVQNLTLLCGFCNRFMRIYAVDEDDKAVEWIIAGGAVGELERRMAV